MWAVVDAVSHFATASWGNELLNVLHLQAVWQLKLSNWFYVGFEIAHSTCTVSSRTRLNEMNGLVQHSFDNCMFVLIHVKVVKGKKRKEKREEM